MSKQVKQTKKAKEEFYSVVTKHLINDKFVRRELENKLNGLTDREIRREISELRKHYAVLSGFLYKRV